MLEWQWLWVFWLTPLPLLLRYSLPAYPQTGDAALCVPRLEHFNLNDNKRQLPASQWLRTLLALCAWLFLLTAAAQPKWIGDAIELPASGRDLMLAVDLSDSMKLEDFQLKGRWVNRLIASQAVASEFIQRRQGDRLGLILFGEQAYLQAPLTFDLQTVDALLQEAFIGLAGPKTAIGDAIAIAIKRLKENPDGERVVILMTDGANTAGEIAPLKAAELAAQAGLKIYTIGIGSDHQIRQGFFGSRSASADLDEDALTAIAEKTGARYFRARDTQAFQQIYQLIDELEPLKQESEYFRPTKALFYIPLCLSALAFVLLGLVNLWQHGIVLEKTTLTNIGEQG